MTDIILELIRAVVIGGLVISLIRASRAASISQIDGWRTMVTGFILILFGSVIDITDNFEALNRFVIVGNTDIQAFLEKVVGYLLGFVLLTVGIRRWLPKLIENDQHTRDRIEVQEERLKVFRATMRTVHGIVNNFLQNLHLFRLKLNKRNAPDPESFSFLDSIVIDTAAKLKKLSDLDSIHEKQMAGGIVIDYEDRPLQ